MLIGGTDENEGAVVPITGARRLEHLQGSLAGLEVSLSPEQVRTLDRPRPPVLNYAFNTPDNASISPHRQLFAHADAPTMKTP